MDLPKISNQHFFSRDRNMRNELFKETDYYMLPDMNEVPSNTQKEEIRNYRKVLR